MTVRVCHVITNLDVGGAESMLLRLLERLDRRRWSSRVVSLVDDGRTAGRIRDLGIPVLPIGMRRGLLPGPLATWQLVRAIREAEPDLIQTWLYHANLLGGLASRFCRPPVPVLWNLRMLAPQACHTVKASTRWAAAACARLSSRLPAEIIANSQAVKASHVELGIATDRIRVIRNGFDPERFAPSPAARRRLGREFGVADDVRLVGMAGRWDPLKDFETFLTAAGRLVNRCRDVRFVLCGQRLDEHNSKLLSAVARSGAAGRVHLLGRRDDMPSLHAALDVAVLASHSEGLPNVIGEAMACGVPCVVTDAGGSAELVGDEGRIVPVGDADALANSIGSLLELSPDDRGRVGAEARARIIEHFSLDGMVAQYERVWDEVLAGTPENVVRRAA